MVSKANKDFGNILRKSRERGIQYSNYIKLHKEEELTLKQKRISIHNRFKIKYGNRYIKQWRE